MCSMQKLHVMKPASRKITIGLLMAVYNAAPLLAQFLPRHVPYFDEIIIVHDGPAVDDTLEVARRLSPWGITIATRYRQGYCEPVRQICLGMATTAWCLALDADEELTREFLGQMRSKVAWATSEGIDGLALGRLETNGEITFHPRLFKRGRAYFSDLIHTNVEGLTTIRMVGKGDPQKRTGDYQMIHHPATEVGASFGRGRADQGEEEALQEKKRRYSHIQDTLRLKYGEYHPELLPTLTVPYLEEK